jgi:hypothetical protein
MDYFEVSLQKKTSCVTKQVMGLADVVQDGYDHHPELQGGPYPERLDSKPIQQSHHPFRSDRNRHQQIPGDKRRRMGPGEVPTSGQSDQNHDRLNYHY